MSDDRPTDLPDPSASVDLELDDPPPLADDPDRSGRDGPAPTDPGITTTDDTLPCPYCGQPVDLFLEPSPQGGVEEFVEECPACCRELEVRVDYDNAGTPHISARRLE